MKPRVALKTRARQQADAGHRAAVVRADRAEHAGRQVTADRDRDRWRRLALEIEAEVRSLRPEGDR